MAKFNTGNSLGSVDPRDLFDNAETLDHYVNDLENSSWLDRFGRQRKTLGSIEGDHTDQLAAHEQEFNAQLADEQKRFTEQLNEQQIEFIHQHSEYSQQLEEQRDEFNDLLSSSGYTWLSDYVNGPITFTNRSQVTVYNGVAYRLAASTPLGFTTSGTTDASFKNDSNNLVAIGDNDVRQQMQYQLGQWLPDTVSIFNITTDYSTLKTRGFYAAYDGGGAVWSATGNTDTSKAGTHIPTSALVYNANGYEYQLKIIDGVIDARANGAVRYTANQQTTDLVIDSDDIVCTGQVINGIVSLVSDSLDNLSNNYADTVDYSLIINCNTGYYRIGKEAIKIKSHVSYQFGRSSFQVIACPSYTHAKTGKYLNALERSVADIEAVYTAMNQAQSWSALSASNFVIDGGFFFGDQKPSVTESSCSSGYGIFGLNLEYFNIKNIYLGGFLWPIMARQINSMTDGNGNNIIESSVVTTAIGNFYGGRFENVRCNAGRRGLAYLDIDWCTWNGGSLCDSADWINGVDAKAPDHFLVERGAAFTISGCNLTVQHSSLSDLKYQPAISVVNSKAKGSNYVGNYLEWTKSFLTISKEGFNTESQMGHGINIDNIGGQYRPDRTWKYVTFEAGCFGSFDSSLAWSDPTKYSSQGAYRGLSFLRIGAPVKNDAAFKHGGYDFKYGTYNLTYTGSVPDVDFLRGLKGSKEFINPYGLQLNSGTLRIPMGNPSLRGNICIWVKDPTGNYDPASMRVWLNGGEGSSAGKWAGRASLTVDFGNGYKLYTIQNLRENVNDGVASDQAYITLQISASSTAPIILKAIEAYTGGIPFFPAGLEYVPESDGEMIWDAASWAGTPNSTQRNYGGGVFKAGDVVNPYARTVANTYDSYNVISRSATVTNSYNNGSRVILSGLTMGNTMNHSFTAPITAVDSTTTTITVPAASAEYIAAGIQHYISSTTGSGATGQVFVGKRIANSDGTLTYQYVLNGVYGAVGDTLTMDGSKLTGYVSTAGNPNFDTRIDVGQSIRVGYNNAAAGTREVQFYPYGSTTLGGRIQWTPGNACIMYGQGSYTVQSDVFTSNVVPRTTATYSLGQSAVTWNNLYLQNAATVVSDERRKTDIQELSEAELACGTALTKLYRRYKLSEAVASKGDDARYHFGTIAQLVIQAFTDAGLDWKLYGIVTYEAWESQDEVVSTVPAVLDEEGNTITEEQTIIVTPAREAGDVYMVRYDEMTAMVMAAQEARLSKLERGQS
ncbi:tail fiber domain-containing protein [Rosenbergiella epipactidis]|uniref:tail fiber domain-containing protein n=1 Tax=Rosenbergiella epipactidis TaxID=1544694 RepID=UPI001F4F6B97|nr:tail fiber domain-containing protein [Rosenbergiella epipactidis]